MPKIQGWGAQPPPPLKPLAQFHRDPRYAGDLHRTDLAWARHAAATGLSVSEIRSEILQGRDLSKKGDPRRQREYAERTAGKAIRQTE
ncbi:MAG TPA: hypothetical protein VE291_05240 [Terracidiphilus sp.]|nr:hypothetical protein [Terracidiphilus sp.]